MRWIKFFLRKQNAKCWNFMRNFRNIVENDERIIMVNQNSPRPSPENSTSKFDSSCRHQNAGATLLAPLTAKTQLVWTLRRDQRLSDGFEAAPARLLDVGSQWGCSRHPSPFSEGMLPP